MHIVHVASEMAPFAKVGGLGDVMLGLPTELAAQGHTVSIFLPKYDCLTAAPERYTKLHDNVSSYYQNAEHANTIWRLQVEDNVQVTLIDSHHARRLFARGEIYGFPDDVDRFLYFSRAVVDYLKKMNIVPDIIHLHDWEVAAIACLIKTPEFQSHFAKTKVVLTVHNLEYQGRCSPQKLEDIGYKGLLDHFRQDNDINLLKGGLLCADSVTTVSPTYAKEALTMEGARGLLSTLQEIQHKFSGILNGLDFKYWNPATDPYISSHYSHESFFDKEPNKLKLQKELGLEVTEQKLLVAAVTRLVHQKGISLLDHAIRYIEKKQAQFVLLGTAFDDAIQAQFNELATLYKNHPSIRLILRNEEAIAHKIYASSNLFLVPSIFEPCGLTQLIALRYGAIPLVRKTGGLADTIFDVDSGKPFSETNGFVFENADTESLQRAIDRALQMWTDSQERWKSLAKIGMQIDHSWKKPAEEYIKLYKQLV